jgi:Glycosyltransferase family 87
MSSEPGQWLTVRRLRAHGLILAVCLWSLYAWNFATPGLHDRSGNLKGADFLHFYTLGSLALAHDGGDLYDMVAQQSIATWRVPQAAGIRYLPLYPPQLSILFAPLATISYGPALIVWLLFSAAIYGLCCVAIFRVCSNLRDEGLTVFLLAAAFPGFFHLIAWGQSSALALACLTSAYLLLRSGRYFWAGVALGCLIFKPQLGLAAAIVFLLTGSWKAIAGAIFSAASQLAMGVIYYGTKPMQQWIHTLLHVREVLPLLEPRPYQTHSLRTFWNMLLPWPHAAFAFYVLSACVVLGFTIALWRNSNATLPLRFSALLLATVLVSPHLTIYDLVILAPAFLLLADWLLAQPFSRHVHRAGALLYLVYLLPLLGPLDSWTHLQLSVIAMAGMIFLIWKMMTWGTERGVSPATQ